MIRLSKQQAKTNERVTAFVRGRELQESSRAKPAVPVMTTREVLEFYRPPYEELGQFFTPLKTARALVDMLPELRSAPRVLNVLDPAAGIGHLLESINKQHWITAYEIEAETCAIGRKILPHVTWLNENGLLAPEGFFDVIVANPPFGKYGALDPSPRKFVSGRNGTHLFLELATVALKVGGTALYVLPYNGKELFGAVPMPKGLEGLFWSKMRLDRVQTIEESVFLGTGVKAQLVKMTKVA